MGPKIEFLQLVTQVPTMDTIDLDDNSSEYVTFSQPPRFSWIYLHLHIISLFLSYSKPVRSLINIGTYLDMIKEDIAKELGLTVYEMKIPQLIVGCFEGKALEKLQNWTSFTLSSRDGVSWKSRVVYVLATKRLVEKMLLGLTFIHLNKLIIDADTGTLTNKHTSYNLIRLCYKRLPLSQSPKTDYIIKRLPEQR